MYTLLFTNYTRMAYIACWMFLVSIEEWCNVGHGAKRELHDDTVLGQLRTLVEFAGRSHHGIYITVYGCMIPIYGSM